MVLERLADPGPVAEVVTAMQRRVGGPALPPRTMLLLTWLRHVGGQPHRLDALRGEPGLDASQRPCRPGGYLMGLEA